MKVHLQITWNEQFTNENIFVNVEIRTDFERQNHQHPEFISSNACRPNIYNEVIFSKVKNRQYLQVFSAPFFPNLNLFLAPNPLTFSLLPSCLPFAHLPSAIEQPHSSLGS